MIAVDFIHQLCTKDVIICSKCNLTLVDWESKRDPLQAHIDYSSWCAFAQKTQQLEEKPIAPSKSISIIESFVPKASLHAPSSTILFAETQSQLISQASSIFVFAPSHIQSLLSSSYEERLINFKTWSHQLSTSTSLAVVDFCYEIDIENLTTCSKCDLTLIDWKSKRNSLRAHKRQSSNCSIAQALSKDQVFSISLNSTPIESCFEATTQSIVEASTSITSSVASVQTSKEETSTSISNSSKTSSLQATSPLLDIDENFASKPSTQLETSRPSTQDLQQSSNPSKSSCAQSISPSSTSIKPCLELVTQSKKAMKATIAKEAQKELAAVKVKPLTTEEATIEASKPEACVNDIDFFDPTMQLNLLEFHLFNTSASFLQRLDVAQYKEQSVLAALAKCLRGPTYIWFKEQLDINSLTSFKAALAKVFPPPTASFIDTSLNSVIPTSSLQYHNCSQCLTKFSSISRLLQHAQKNNCSQVACKHCEEDFSSNNKLHEHVRLKHARRSANPPTSSTNSLAPRASLRAPQPSILATKTWQTSTFDAPSTPPSTPSIVPRKLVATLRHRLKEREGKHSTVLATSRPSRLPRPVQLLATSLANPLAPRAPLQTPQSTLLPSKALHTPILHTPPTPPPTPSHTPKLRHQSTNHVTKRLLFKLYMTIDDLYIMFHEKSSKKSVNIIQKRVLSSMPGQARIIDYFRLVALTPPPNDICRLSTPSTSQSTRTLLNRKPKASHIATDEIANLKTQRKLKTFKSNRFEIDLSSAPRAWASTNYKPRTSKAQSKTQHKLKAPKFELFTTTSTASTLSTCEPVKDLKQSSNSNSSTSITSSSTLRLNRPISSLTSPSKSSLLCALIRATIKQLTPYFPILSDKVPRRRWRRPYWHRYSLRDEAEREREVTQLFRACGPRIVQIRALCNWAHLQPYRHASQSNALAPVPWA